MKRKSVFRGIASLLCVVLLFSPLTAGASLEELVPTLTWEEKLSAEVVSQMEMGETTAQPNKIPVYVWLKDINQTQVDTQVELETGLTVESLSVVTEAIPETLSQALYALSAGEEPVANTADEMQAYLERTEPLRAIEKQRTDTYIQTRREIAREEYVEKNDGVLDACDIPAADVLFRSQYAPMLILSLTPAQIETVAKHPQVESVEQYIELEATLDYSGTPPSDMIEYNGISRIHDDIGLDGSGVNVGIIDIDTLVPDAYLPADRVHVLGIPYHPEATDDHAENCARIMAGTDGVAPEAEIYSVSLQAGAFFTGVELLLSAGVKVISCSVGYSRTSVYSSIEQWTDHVISIHNVSFTKSGGNFFSRIISAPGLADNVITVGGYDDKANTNPSDDTMFPYSYINTESDQTGCMKPDLVAPASVLLQGTSSATPVVAGTIALMLQLRPSLAAYPQAVKAILLASCQRKALKCSADTDAQETMAQGLTDKQGAGVMDAYLAICITGAGHYAIREMPAYTVGQTFRLKVPSYGASGLNVSLAWLREGTVTGGEHAEGDVTADPRVNMNLWVTYHNTNGSSVTKKSENTVSSTEMVYLTDMASVSDYTIQVNKVGSSSSEVRFAYAWCLENEPFQGATEFEGIYFLKNENGQYLTLNTSTRALTRQAFTGAENQQWVIRKSGSQYIIQTVSSAAPGGIAWGSYIGRDENQNVYSANLSSAGSGASVNISWNADGSVSFWRTVSGVSYAFGFHSNSSGTFTGSMATWFLASGGINYHDQEWSLESLAYRKGDVDRNGLVNSNDARMVSQSTVGTITLTDVQFYLADMDNDGVVNSNDWRLILQAAVS